MNKLSESASKVDLGVSGQNTYSGLPYADEFLTDLRGNRAIQKYREMRDNNATIGAVMYAVEQTLRDVEIKVVPKDATKEAQDAADFIKTVLDDMDHSLDDHIAEALSSLTYGFSWFETVYKVRGGDARSSKKNSKYNDGKIGIKKLAIRAPWTVYRFEVDKETSEVLGMHQMVSWGKASVYIPVEKSVYYRTTSLNNDPTGRSVLRNAFVAYTYLNRIQSYEAIAIERELHGVPIGRMPAEYLSADATADQAALRQQFERILRDLKYNQQGFALLPSDLQPDVDGKLTNQRMMDIELITANGTRAIDTDPVIQRYQHDIARSVMAEFMMLGGGATGSYALSKTKTDLFLRSMESYINNIVDTLNKQLVEPLWKLNGFSWDVMPKLVAGDVAPHDLKELASFLRNLNGANINVADQIGAVEELMHIAELPFDKDQYIKVQQEQKAQDAKAQEAALQQPQQPKPKVM